MSDFDDDLRTAKENLELARADLLAELAAAEGRMDAGSRGGWSVDQVLQHVIDSENQYAAGIVMLRGGTPSRPEPVGEVGSLERARAALGDAREALFSALEGVDEETFYRMGRLMHQDYSVLSVLENVELHDREHEAQIRRLLHSG
jgi:hypothetical protein